MHTPAAIKDVERQCIKWWTSVNDTRAAYVSYAVFFSQNYQIDNDELYVEF